MKKFLLFVSCILFLVIISRAQKISYVVSFPNIVHHEAQVSITATGLTQQNSIFRMSRSSPGRYATHEFGKNIYDVKAFDKSGNPVTINRIDADVYEVPRNDGFVRVEYTLYGNYADGTYVGIDPSSIHLNMPGAFMWLKGYDKSPIDIKFNLPTEKNWTIATQLKPTTDPTLFTAPGLQYFMDCPTKIGSLVWKSWNTKNPSGKTYTFRLALEAATNDSLAGAFAEKVRHVTEEAAAVYGELPDYDYGTYTFIASINPWVRGDGMEHRNSTMITVPTIFTGANDLLGVFSHEFFHCWNVERIRPRTLEPFNFEKSNMSNELWCAEGFTQYYGDLLLMRAGLETQNEFLGAMARLVNTKENTPGAKRFSPAAMSRNAVFVDAGVSIDRNNYINSYSSYYPYGGAIALALDLELRSRFKLTLDDYMTALWKKYGKTAVSYTIPGLEDALARLTNDAKFANSFFSSYITGHVSFDYKPLLEKAGLTVKNIFEGKAWIGRVQYREGPALTIASNTVIGTPLYDAGLDIDDQITLLDGKPVKTAMDIDDILKTHKPGDRMPIEFKHRDEKETAVITAAENLFYSIVPMENATDEMMQFRKNWLGSKVGLSRL